MILKLICNLCYSELASGPLGPTSLQYFQRLASEHPPLCSAVLVTPPPLEGALTPAEIAEFDLHREILR